MEAVRLLLGRGADVNAKDNVSTCECTDVSVSLVCFSVCLSVSLSVSFVVGIYQYSLFVMLSLALY